MAHITVDHLRHMAQRHHATMLKFDNFRDKFVGVARTAETLAGAWVGGALEGRTAGAAIGPLPVNLGVGIALVALGHSKFVGARGNDLENVGNGFIGSWAAAAGYNFGKSWKESGKTFP